MVEYHTHKPDWATPELDAFYSSWMKPDVRNDKGERYASCCNYTDCKPTPVVQRKDGSYWVEVEGDWFPLLPTKLEENQLDPRDSPDGQSHACLSFTRDSNTNRIIAITAYCAVRGSGQ